MARVLVAAAAVAAGLVLLGSAAGGSFSGTNGLIGFTCGSSICKINPDGSSGGAFITSATDPAWSADGTEIAFVKTGSGIWTADADGSFASLFLANATEPTWAPDDAIAYVKTDGKIYAYDSGTETNLTTSGADAWPSYSPDGTKLAYVEAAGGGSYNIRVLTISPRSVATIATATSSTAAPSWAPNGSTIVFESGGTLYKVPANGSSGATSLGVTGTWPSYSPDGTKIAYASATQHPAVVNADGTGAQTLSSTLTASQVDWGQADLTTSSGSGGNTGNGPTNTSYPTITLTSGDTTPVAGHTLTATTGSWSGTFPITYTFQWKRCDPADPVNGPCVDIPGATASSYVPTTADYKYRLRVGVTAKDANGTTSQNSEVTAPVAAIAPKNTATPPVTPGGSPQVDQTLTVTPGTWSGSTPIDYTYSWRRCNPVGDIGTCVPIVGATAATYVPTVPDIGFSLRVWITGTNLVGSDVVITNHTFPVVDKPHFAPSVIDAPTITGTALPGRQLTAAIGTFKGDLPLATKFQWYRCNALGEDCHAIASGKKLVYYPTSDDVGYTLRLYVFATNAYGNFLAKSDPTDAVAATPPHLRGRRIVGTAKGDYLAGGGHDDVIIGLGGNDTILGGAGDDRLTGGPGNDVITGGAGADRIDGGPGSDWIVAVDGERDVVDCGDGDDHVIADAVDILHNCESVQTISAS